MLHRSAIPIEILVAVFITKRILEQNEIREKQRRLMYLKSYLSRSEMRNLFIINFAALRTPAVTFEKIRNSTLEELKQFRRNIMEIEYKSLEAIARFR